MTHRIGERVRTLAIAVALFIGLIGLEIGQHSAAAEPAHPYPRICFPAQKWNAAPGDRPCAYIRLYEDGTFRSQVEQADGDPIPRD